MGSEPPIADHQGFLDLAVRAAVRDREAARSRAGRNRPDAETSDASDCVHHPLGFFKAPGEVLVVIDGNGAAVLLKNVYALFEELVARIEYLSLFIARVIRHVRR